ncbi:hypothetical protein DFH27DRAFT_554532 [Peziza echinospora]|nr:hypothetical protein DFH27DRAFT_554532 [Peziza echinospora]
MPVFPPTPATSSSPQGSSDDPVCTNKTLRLVILFLRRRQSGEVGGDITTANLRIEDPDSDVLWLLEEARDSSADLAPNHPFAGIASAVLKSLRIRWIPTANPPVLILLAMKTAVHDCIQEFIPRYLFPRLSSGKSDLLTPGEVGNLSVSYGTTTPLPGGPSGGGFRDPAPSTRRATTRAIEKEPAVSIKYVPRMPLSYDGDNEDETDDDNEDETDDDNNGEELWGEALRSIPFFPSLVIEVGYSEEYEDLKADCNDYLVSAGGEIQLAILVKISESDSIEKPSSSPALIPTSRGDHVDQEMEDSRPPSPDSTHEDYKATSKALWNQVGTRLDAFLECWELGEGDIIRLRCPRIQLLKKGKIVRKINVPMCRADFGVDFVGQDEDVVKQMVKVKWNEYAGMLRSAGKQMIIANELRKRKVLRADKRVREGDVGPDYVPTHSDGSDRDDDMEGEGLYDVRFVNKPPSVLL